MLTLAEARMMLADLGFWFLRTPPTNNVAFWVELATREFQRYARLPKVAKDPTPGGPVDEYPRRLVQVEVDNTSRLPATVPVDGDYNNPETEARIRAWHAGDTNWRIPIVISAWNTKANGEPLGIRPKCSNIWLAKEVAVSKRVRMYATDLTDLYMPFHPVGRFLLVGSYVKFPPWGGPQSAAGRHTIMKITYERLTGDLPDPPTTPEQERRQKTYRVIAGVAAAEAENYFDALNAYDDSVISVGFYQWTLGRVLKDANQNLRITSGELGGYMALLKDRKAQYDDPAFDDVLGRWDLDVNHDWDNTDLFNDDNKTYTTHLTEKQKVGGVFQSVAIRDGNRAQFFQSWHWFYRFQAATRFLSPFRWSMWHMARVRLRDVLSTPWPANLPNTPTPKFRREDGTLRSATIGEVYRSEMSLAIVLRWHVWAPGEVIFDGAVGRAIRRAFTRACQGSPEGPGVNPSLPVQDWPGEYEEALIVGLLKQAPLKVFDNDTRVRDHFVGSLARVRAAETSELTPSKLQRSRDFDFDDTNLPPPQP